MKNTIIVLALCLAASAAIAQSVNTAKAQLGRASEVDGAIWADHGMAVSPGAAVAGKSGQIPPLAPATGHALDEAKVRGVEKVRNHLPYEGMMLVPLIPATIGLAVAAIAVGVLVAPPAGLVAAGILGGLAAVACYMCIDIAFF